MGEHNQRREAASIDERGLRAPAAYSIRDGATGVLKLEGELDLAAAPALRKRIDEFDGESLVLDFGRVTFIDSAVLKELLRARAELSENGVALVLAGVPAPVRRLLDLTRTSELFEDAPDVDSALKRLSG
jgi:anti-sigma B factor antagonist